MTLDSDDTRPDYVKMSSSQEMAKRSGSFRGTLGTAALQGYVYSWLWHHIPSATDVCKIDRRHQVELDAPVFATTLQ